MQLGLFTRLFLPFVGSDPALTLSEHQSLYDVLTQHPTAALKAGHKESFKPAQPKQMPSKAPGRILLIS